MINKFQKTLNFLHFHRRRVAVSCAFVGGYSYTCHKARFWQNDVLRLGVAGSLATVVVECGFHFADTVNIRAKSAST